MFLIPWHYTVVQEIGSHQGVLAIVELYESYLSVGINEGLLVDSTDALQRAYVVGILGTQVTRVQALDLSVGLLLGLSLFKRSQLLFGKDKIFLSSFRFQCLEPFLECLQIMAEPDGPDTTWGNEDTFLLQFVRGPELTVGRLFDSKLYNCILDVLFDAILDTGLLTADFLKGKLPTLLVQFLKPVEAVPGIPHYLACLRDIP